MVNPLEIEVWNDGLGRPPKPAREPRALPISEFGIGFPRKEIGRLAAISANARQRMSCFSR
jgi:hypothetical protein